MNSHELTSGGAPATSIPMRNHGREFRRTVCHVAVPVLGAMMLGGCVSVTAPDKPIVIELNINIKQEVIYRIAKDVANTIEENPEIF